jgi:uncharacterized DUF497 family protein
LLIQQSYNFLIKSFRYTFISRKEFKSNLLSYFYKIELQNSVVKDQSWESRTRIQNQNPESRTRTPESRLVVIADTKDQLLESRLVVITDTKDQPPESRLVVITDTKDQPSESRLVVIADTKDQPPESRLVVIADTKDQPPESRLVVIADTKDQLPESRSQNSESKISDIFYLRSRSFTNRTQTNQGLRNSWIK